MVTETRTRVSFEMIARRAKSHQISVKLGFCDRSPHTLSSATNIVVRTLKDYGHTVEQINARASHRVEVECDAFRLDVRHRRSPTPLRQMNGEPCKSQLEILVVPRFTDHLDAEITELLLAMILHNLISEMQSATTITWVGSRTELDCATFLSAFEPKNGAVPHADLGVFPNTKTAEGDETRERVIDMVPITPPPTRARQRNRFAPVDATFHELATQCEKLAGSLPPERAQTCQTSLRSSDPSFLWGTRLDRVATWATTLAVGLVSVPLAITTVAVMLLRSRDPHYGVQMMIVLSLVALIQSSDILQAALK